MKGNGARDSAACAKAPAPQGLDLRHAGRTPSASLATLIYLAAAVAMTWPLALGLHRDIPWDLGDSVLNCWILQWGADHILRFLAGDFRALSGYFNGNIFYPEPLAIAYSEHMTTQVLQILPVYAVTKNVVLCYNLLFLSTFVLSGLGTYLLVRELTGSPRAALVAGLLYAFAPYRIGQFSHVQVMSSQWMPFALYAFRRYFDTRRLWPLAGAAAALVAQFLSCGYFLMYFAPLAAAYVLYEIADRGAWREWRMWGALAAAAAAVMALTVPFLLPYVELRARGFGPRPFEEVVHYSADVYSYLVAHEAQRFWGWFVRAYPKPEGDLFPSLTPVLLALVGVLAHARSAWAAAGRETITPGVIVSRWRQVASGIAALVLLSQVAAVLLILANNGVDLSIGPLVFRVHNFARALRTALIAAAALAILSPRARAWMRGVPGSAVAFYVAALLIACWMSLGPVLYTHGQRIAGDGLYGWFYANVPGFDGVRVPARFGMLVALFLAVLGGYGAAAIERRWPRRGGAVLMIAGAFFLVESTSAPIELNGTWHVEGTVKPPVPLIPAGGPPAIYGAVGRLPASAVLAEFPFGEEQFDMRYMVWSAAHWRPLLNGYSGGFPRAYAVNRAALSRVLDAPDRAWAVLARSGATHVVVHEGFYLDGRGEVVSAWLEQHGATPVAAAGGARLFVLPSPTFPGA
jgi:hypothetical protein